MNAVVDVINECRSCHKSFTYQMNLACESKQEVVNLCPVCTKKAKGHLSEYCMGNCSCTKAPSLTMLDSSVSGQLLNG